MRPFRLSLLGYDDSEADAVTPQHVDLGRVHLVGVGAVGSALVYALAHLPALAGQLHPIDNDRVDGTNLQRYVLMRRGDVGEPKPDVAARALRPRGLTLLPYLGSFAEFAEQHGRDLDLLVTPVDSEAGRRQLAAELPRAVLNAATGETTVTLSRHGFADGGACLRCLYLAER